MRHSKSRQLGLHHLEPLESRTLLTAATLLGTVALPTSTTSTWSYPDGAYNASPIFADLTGDGHDILLTVGADGNLYGYTYNSTSNQIILYGSNNQVPTIVPPIQSTPVVTTVPGVGTAIFAAASDGMVYGWNASTGALLPGWPVSIAVPGASSNAVYGSLAAADLDGDGSPEILVTSMNHELTVLHANGQVDWKFNNDAPIIGGAVVGDLNNDGQMDVVIAGESDSGTAYDQGGRITALTPDGKRMWVRQTPAPIDSSPVLADLTGNGYLDVIVGTTYRTLPSAANVVYAIDRNGNDLPGWPFVTNSSASTAAGVYSSPAVGDLTGNGSLDVVIADASGVVHAIKPNGTALWAASVFSPSQPTYSTPILADVNGDGTLDVVMTAGSSVFGLSGVDGSNVFAYTDVTNTEAYRTSVAVGHFLGDSSWQMAFVADGIDSSQNLLAPSELHIYNLPTSTVAPAWAMIRRDAAANAVTRTQAQAVALTNALFENAADRAPVSAELAAWTDTFEHTPSLLPYVAVLVGSTEARAIQIQSWYQAYLGRGADPGGLAYWQSYLTAGHTYSDVQAQFVASAEAFSLAGGTNAAWVTFMYQKLLGRTPAASEVAYWVGQLTTGNMQRSDVAHGFLNSVELTQGRVLAWYAAYRPGGIAVPSADELEAASWDLRRGQTEESVLSRIIGSLGDYAATQQEASFIRTLYGDLLGRAPAPAELAYWLTVMEGGATTAVIATAIQTSNEYRDRLVAQYYETYLGRAAGAAEQAYWAGVLGSGQTRASVIAAIMDSDEYYARAGGTTTGFVRQVYVDLLGRAPSTAETNTWIQQSATTNIRTMLPTTALKSSEYFTLVIAQEFMKFLRRSPTPAGDSSAYLPAGTPYGAQYWLTYLTSGTGQPENMELGILASPEYLAVATTHALWTGTRWKGT